MTCLILNRSTLTSAATTGRPPPVHCALSQRLVLFRRAVRPPLPPGARRGRSGRVFIDRDGTPFRHVLNYLRQGGRLELESLNLSRADLALLKGEVEFYQLTSLLEAIEQTCARRQQPTVICLEHTYYQRVSTYRGRPIENTEDEVLASLSLLLHEGFTCLRFNREQPQNERNQWKTMAVLYHPEKRPSDATVETLEEYVDQVRVVCGTEYFRAQEEASSSDDERK